MKRVFYLSVMIGLITVFLSAVPPVPGKTTGLPIFTFKSRSEQRFTAKHFSFDGGIQ
jgi:hypothetical protein